MVVNYKGIAERIVNSYGDDTQGLHELLEKNQNYLEDPNWEFDKFIQRHTSVFCDDRDYYNIAIQIEKVGAEKYFALTTPAHVSFFRDIRDKVIDRLCDLRDSRRGKMYKRYLEYRFEGGKLAASECIFTSYEETMKKFEERLKSYIKYAKDHPIYHGTEFEERAEGIKEATEIFREEYENFKKKLSGYRTSIPKRKKAIPKKRTPAVRVNVRKMF